MAGQPCALHRRLRSADGLRLLARRRRDVRIACRVHHGPRPDHAARPVRQRHDDTRQDVAVQEHAYGQRSEQDPHARRPAGLAIPLRLGHREHRTGGVHAGVDVRRRKPARVAVVILADAPVGLHAAHAVEELDHNRVGARPPGRDRGGSARGARAHHQHLALGQHRERAQPLGHDTRRVGVHGRQAAQQLANLLRARRQPRLLRQRHARERAARQRGGGRRRADAVAERHQPRRVLHVRGQRARHVGPYAEHVQVGHAGGPERVEVQRPRVCPGGRRLGRHAHDVVGRQPRQAVRLIDAGADPRQVARGLLDLEQFQHGAAHEVGRECAPEDAARDSSGHARGRSHAGDRGLVGGARKLIHAQAWSGGRVGGVGDDDPRKAVRAGREGRLRRACAPRRPGALGRVDHGAGRHRLSALAVGEHHARRTSLAVLEHVTNGAASQERDTRVLQGLLQPALERQRRGVVAAARKGVAQAGVHHQLVEQLANRAGAAVAVHAQVLGANPARQRYARHEGGDAAAGRQRLHRDAGGRSRPRGAVEAGVDRGDHGVERAARRAVVVVHVRLHHGAGARERRRDLHVRVVLDAIAGGVVLHAVGEPRVGRVGMRGVRRQARRVGERHLEREELPREGLADELGDGRRPKLARAGQLVAEIGARGDQKHARAVGLGGDGGRHGRAAAAHDHNVRIADHRHLARRLNHGLGAPRGRRRSG